MNLENKVKNRFNISEILKNLLLKVSKLEKNTASTQVNADWNATSGPTQILNKPNIFKEAIYQIRPLINNDIQYITTIVNNTSLNLFGNWQHFSPGYWYINIQKPVNTKVLFEINQDFSGIGTPAYIVNGTAFDNSSSVQFIFTIRDLSGNLIDITNINLPTLLIKVKHYI